MGPCFGRKRQNGRADRRELSAQAAGLIEQPQHDGIRLLVEAQVVMQIGDQADPRFIHLAEQIALASAAFGQDPTPLDPAPQLASADPGPQCHLFEGHRHGIAS
jgi:hypothetical protein